MSAPLLPAITLSTMIRHLAAWGMAAISTAMIVTGLFGLADSTGMYIGATTVIVGLALWSFIAVVFRKFF